ncbi:tectonic-like complex member MKS1 [Amphiura filiformis]|uniref:tectonic-like complex member MKS1 n=1 Tax=Amphiura filiformis TaxID=82378 RepID=UPI003B21EC24
MADESEADFGTAYYRSRDPIKNFRIRVTIKRVTGLSLVPTFSGGGGVGLVGEDIPQAGPSHDNVEMRPIGSKQTNNNASTSPEVDDYTYKWQEKVFNQREIDLYSDAQNCFNPLDQKYHEEVVELNENGTRKTKRLFSYVDHDRFTNMDEQCLMTTSPTEQPSYLSERMTNVRRRKQRERRKERYADAGVFLPKSNLMVDVPTDEDKRATHVIDTPVQTMHIMADLASAEEKSTVTDEYVLCTIKYDAHGVLSVTPDFNHHRPAYTIITESGRRDTYEYTLSLASEKMSRREQDRESKMYKELYQRHTEYIGAMVGHEFEQVPTGMLRMCVFGEIVSAKNFEYDNLYVHFFVELPQYWSADRSQQLSGVTQTCATKEIDKEDVAFFSYPFEFEVFYKNEETSDNDVLPGLPQIFLEVLSIDSWLRYRTEGYGYITLPSTPGMHALEVNTWRPAGRGANDDLRRFFIGGSPELEDPTYTSVPITYEGDKVISKFGFKTVTMGSVSLKLNILHQSQTFMDRATSRKRVGTLLDKLGGLSMQASVTSVLELFQRARKRMQAARETLAS